MDIRDTLKGKKRNPGEEEIIINGLVSLLSYDKELVQNLTAGTLDQGYSRKLANKTKKDFGDCVRLGLVYIFEGKIYDAQRNFQEASSIPNRRLGPYLKAVSSNILIAYSFLNSAQSRMGIAKPKDAGAH